MRSKAGRRSSAWRVPVTTDHGWHSLHTGQALGRAHPADDRSAGHLARLPLPPLPPVAFVRSTILSANWADDDLQPVQHEPTPYVFPLRAASRQQRQQQQQLGNQQKAPVTNEHDPILISDDEEDERGFEVTRVTRIKRSDRPGIGAGAVTTLKAEHPDNSIRCSSASEHGTVKQGNSVAEVVVIEDEDDNVGRFNMAQTYAALIESIGGSTQKADATLAINSEPHQVIDDSDDEFEIIQVVNARARLSTGLQRVTSSSRPASRPRYAETPARLPLSPFMSPTAQTQRKARNRTMVSVQQRPPWFSKKQWKRWRNKQNKQAAKIKLKNSSDIARHSRYIGTVPCPQCQMLIPDRITPAQLRDHRASMPHRLAVGRLGGRPDQILAETARQVEKLRQESERRRARTRALLSCLGVSAGQDVGPDRLLTLTRQGNRGFELLEKAGWEAGMGIGKKEWLRSRRIRKHAKEQERLQKEREKVVRAAAEAIDSSTMVGEMTSIDRAEGMQTGKKEGGVGSLVRIPSHLEDPQSPDVDALAERMIGATLSRALTENNDAAGPAALPPAAQLGDCSVAQSEAASPVVIRPTRQVRLQRFKERAARLRAAGNTADSAIALSDSDGEDDPAFGDAGRLQVDGEDSGEFLDYGFDDSSDDDDDSTPHVDGPAEEDEDDGSDVEWVGVDTKRKRGEGIHAWLLRKNDVNQLAKKVEANKKRKRGEDREEDEDEDGGEDGQEGEEGDDEEEDPDEIAVRAAQAAAAAAAAGSTVPVPAMNHVSRTQPLADSIKMQHALDKSGIGASSACQTPARLAATVGRPVDVLSFKSFLFRGPSGGQGREAGEDTEFRGQTRRVAQRFPFFRRDQHTRRR